VPKCDGSDPGCVLITDTLWTGQPTAGPAHPTTHRFDGDTLIYHANTSQMADPYRGPIYAWRPGWPAGRQISLTTLAYACSAHPSAEAVVCIENLTTDPAAALQFDLTGGPLATGAKLVARITPTRPNTQSSQWRVAFTRGGDALTWSTGGLTVAERETIYTAKVADLGTPGMVTTVATGVSRWEMSAEGKKIFYLKDYNYDTQGVPQGSLTVADFPSGANPTLLAPAIPGFVALSAGGTDRGVAFFANVQLGQSADFKMIADVANPAGVISVLSGIAGVSAISGDLRFVLYSTDFDPGTGGTDVRVARLDGSSLTTGGCVLTDMPTSDFFGAPFTPNSELVMWVENVDQIDGVATGFVARTDCTSKRQFGDRADFWFFDGNRGVLYSDEGVAQEATLKSAPIVGGNSLGAPTVLQRQVARIYGVPTTFEAALFTVVGAPLAGDGIYFIRVPFASSSSDGGAGG
jgi:hypothetical protein